MIDSNIHDRIEYIRLSDALSQGAEYADFWSGHELQTRCRLRAPDKESLRLRPSA